MPEVASFRSEPSPCNAQGSIRDALRELPFAVEDVLIVNASIESGSLVGLNAETGEELWRARLPTAANALPMTYQLEEGGRQYVVVASGGHWTGGSPPGDYLIAFALPEDQN